MAQRTRTIQRTPNVGLTLKMQSLQEAAPCEPCVPAPTVARWFNYETHEYDLETAHVAINKYACISAMEVAQVNGDLCDCKTEWDFMWDPAEETELLHDFVIRTPGCALAVYSPPWSGLAGVLTATPTIICPTGRRIVLNPIYLVSVNDY
jgi:hypothetical protein